MAIIVFLGDEDDETDEADHEDEDVVNHKDNMKINIKINMKMTMKIIIKMTIKAISTNMKLIVKMFMKMIIEIRALLDHCHFEGKISITISSVYHLLLQSSATVQRGLSYPSICRQNI